MKVILKVQKKTTIILTGRRRRWGRRPDPEGDRHGQQGQQEEQEAGQDAAQHQEGAQKEKEEGEGSTV